MTYDDMDYRIKEKLKQMRDGEIRIIIRDGEIKHVNVLEEFKPKEPYHSSKKSLTKF